MSTRERTQPVPALLNCRAGTAADARRIVASDDRFELREVEPVELADSLREVVDRGSRRVLVCGGDGSIAAAAGALAGSGVELAILPGGTLNHFARDYSVPTDLREALEVALSGRPVTADVGEVNGRIFLNTFSVGSYVRFVRRRERLEPWIGYRVASFAAGIAVLADLRGYSLELEVGGLAQLYSTPLVFVGVGERDLTIPKLGRRRDEGARGLHAMIVRSRARARIVTIALAAAARGVERAARTPVLDAFLVGQCRVHLSRSHTTVALDGELVRLTTPLQLKLIPDALTIVTGERSPVATDSASETPARSPPTPATPA